jgi:hypothetical protein
MPPDRRVSEPPSTTGPGPGSGDLDHSSRLIFQVTYGNLTRDPELRYTSSGQASSFSIAVNRFYTNRNGEKVEQTDFLTVNAWRSVGVNVAESSPPERGCSSPAGCRAATGRPVCES